MTDYNPISCNDHDRLELAVMHGTPLQITYRDEAGHTHTETQVRATDVKTRDGAEWLAFKLSSGETRNLRLDWIGSFEELTPGA